MGFDSNLRARARKLAEEKEKDLSLDDIFRSSELNQYFDNISDSLRGNNGKNNVTIFSGDPGTTAWTDGSNIHINQNSELISSRMTPEAKFLALVGFFMHETAHTIFLDFNEEERARNYIQKGMLYGQMPSHLTAEEDQILTDMVLALNDPATRQIFMMAFHEISNILSDVHDEESLIEWLGSFAGEPLYVLRSSLQDFCCFFEDEVAEMKKQNGSELAMMFNFILQVCRFGYVMSRDPDEVKNSEYWETLQKIEAHAKVGSVTDDTSRKYHEMNYIMMYLWPYIQKEVNKNQNGQSGDQGDSGDDQPDQSGNQSGQSSQSSQSSQNGQSGQNNQGSQNSQGVQNSQNNQNGQGNQGNQNSQSGQNNQQGNQNGKSGGNSGNQQNGNANRNQNKPMTQEQIQKVLDALKKGAQNAGSTNSQKNKHSSQEAVDRRQASAGKDQNPQHNPAPDNSFSNDNIGMILKAMKKEIARNEAEHEIEMEEVDGCNIEVSTVNQTSSHAGIQINVDRVLAVSPDDKQVWDSLMQNLKSVSKRAQKQIMEALRDLREGRVEKRKVFGKALVAEDTYRLDSRVFSNKKAPEDYPDMAVSILVDCSGSMHGERIREAKRAAMLLYDFCTGINIPVAIAGHNTTSHGSINYIVCTTHEKVGPSDKYRINHLRPNGCNRDGAALNVSSALLQKRNEQIKLLIVISDGQPNDQDYGGEKAAQDIQEIMRKCHKKGIEVLAAAIGNDQDNIKRIYGDAFLNISQPEKLSKDLIKIIRKRILDAAM